MVKIQNRFGFHHFQQFLQLYLTTRLIWVLSLMLFIQYLICISQIIFLIQVTQYIAIFLFFLRFFFSHLFVKFFPLHPMLKPQG